MCDNRAMSSPLTPQQLEAINRKIADRSNVFYWQTDRLITPQEAGAIWADRHRNLEDSDIIAAVNAVLPDDPVASLAPLDPAAQTSLGNVNSVRLATRVSGTEVIIRIHPRGVYNGYFYAESAASQKAMDAGLPAFKTYIIHELANPNDFAFQVCQKLPGDAMQVWLAKHPEDEAKLLFDIGVCMAKLHKLSVTGFGPFDNQKAKDGDLVGLHDTFAGAVRAGLAFNLKTLVERDIITKAQGAAVDKLLSMDNPLLGCKKPTLIHNDFADWNALTDGQKITGMIDWDECVAGDPVADIACWSTFFEPERLAGMLKGYWSIADKPNDFDQKFELLRLRYTVSKMTLRVRRYEWNPSDAIKQRIEIGKKHLAVSMQYFDIV